jgi:hypothetical protein
MMPGRFWPSTRAAAIDTKAMESTPNRPAKKSRSIEKSKTITTGTVPAAQHQFAKSLFQLTQAKAPKTSPANAIAINARRAILSVNKSRIRVSY